jgi:predicted metal-dependent peptidase
MFNEIISKTKLQVRRECQFFGALMLFASIKESNKIDTACTDGKDIFFNQSFLESLSSSEQNALMLHEVLHIALLHVQRRQSRDPMIWNIAADIVVNDLILRNTTFKLPKDAIINYSYKDKSVEYIYEALLKKNKYKKYSLHISDLEQSASEFSEEEEQEIAGYWKDKIQVLKNSDLGDENSSQGNLPAGMSQEIEVILEPEVDWRHALWRYVGKTPADFDDLDRRFLYRGLYLEGLLTEALEVSVCIDTSGSISVNLLDQFLGELKGILRSYPHVKCDLFFADSEVDGPYEIHSIEELPPVTGFGGTSFVPFFNYLEKNDNNLLSSNKVSIYFTDGYGDFPSQTPKDPTMWLVCKDGLETNMFPFGEVIRISTESY